MADRNFVFYSDWRNLINGLSSEADKLQLFTAVMDYGVTGECDLLKMSPMVRNIFESMIKPAINRSQKNYSDSIEYGKTHGRPKTVDDELIKELFKAGLRARDIAKELGISEAAVYHSDGWKNRRN